MAQSLHGTSFATNASTRGPGMHHRETLLLLYVVDYCEKRQYTEAATALRREGRVSPDAILPIDSKEGLLLEWWTCFWEIYTARLHPDKAHSDVAKIYSDNLKQSRFGPPRDVGQPLNGRLGGHAPGTASQTPPGVNGQGPSPSYPANTTHMNGVQLGLPATGGAIPGMPAAAVHNNPALQHLQQPPRLMPGYPQPPGGPGMPSQPMYMPRPPGAPMGHMGGPMQPQRMPNGAVYPNYRPPGAQQSPQQHQDMQTAGASGSPKQPATAQNSSPRIQEAMRNGTSYEASGTENHQQGTPRTQASRGQKRPSPAEEDQYSKDDSPPSHKKPRRSPQENGSALPNTPSLSAAQPPGPGRPSAPAGSFNGMGPSKPNPPMSSMPFAPPGVSNAPTNLPSDMAGQLQQLSNTHTQRSQAAAMAQTNQQYFAQMQQTAVTNYNIKPVYQPPQNPGQPGTSEQTVRGATIPPKGSMLPPPPPSSSAAQPPPGNGNGTPGKNTPVMSGLGPRNPQNKDGSSPGGQEGISPESVRPGSRPISGTTPQMTPASMPGAASTPGGPSAISAPSPSQMNTPQQVLSRPQTQSPSSAAMARPPSAAATANPSALLARGFNGGPSVPGGAAGAPGVPTIQSTPAHSASGMGGSASMLGGSEPLSNDLFSLAAPFEFQMMEYQEPGSYGSDMVFGGFGLDDPYNLYINESSLGDAP